MTKRLTDSDRRAVDLLLDRSAATGDVNGYVTHAQPATEPGIQSVQRVLNLLDALPVAEPSSDLLARTLSRIDVRSGATSEPLNATTEALMTNRPHA